MESTDSNDQPVPRAAAGARDRSPISLIGFRPTFLDDLVRLGPDRDGGYVVNERSVLQSQYLMSFGVNDDWSFELDFLNRKPDVKVSCFDPYVSKRLFLGGMLNAVSEVLSLRFVMLTLLLNFRRVRARLSEVKSRTGIYKGFSRFLAMKNVRFYSLGISDVKTKEFVTFGDALKLCGDKIPDNSVFVKMDIERFEFRVIPDLLNFERYINGLVVEFHDLDILWTEFVQLIAQLREHFEITHIHGNNMGGCIPNSEVPLTLEITFLKRGLIHEERPVAEDRSYPIPQLDFPNVRSEKDYKLVF